LSCTSGRFSCGDVYFVQMWCGCGGSRAGAVPQQLECMLQEVLACGAPASPHCQSYVSPYWLCLWLFRAWSAVRTVLCVVRQQEQPLVQACGQAQQQGRGPCTPCSRYCVGALCWLRLCLFLCSLNITGSSFVVGCSCLSYVTSRRQNKAAKQRLFAAAACCCLTQ
jgi:hypothetical protein